MKSSLWRLKITLKSVEVRGIKIKKQSSVKPGREKSSGLLNWDWQTYMGLL